MGFGTEVLFLIILGLVVLGPKRLHTVLQHVAQMRADFEKASRGVKSQLAAELKVFLRTSKPSSRINE
jgi:Sec-independent protein translocase protein TatA